FGQSNMHAAGKSLPILAIAIFLSFPIAMGLANTLLVLLLVAWLLSGAYKERWITIRANPVAIAALLLYCVILVGALYSTAPINDILLHFNKYSKLLFAVILICVLTERKWQQYCLNAYTVAMFFILASTWLNIWFLLPWSKSQELGWGYSHHVVGDYITQNVMMSFFVLLSLVYAYNQKNLLIRLAWAITAIMGAVSITHLSRGRTGYV